MADSVVEEKMSNWTYNGAADYLDTWFLMRSPVPIFCIAALYLLFVLKLGPEYMKNRPPYNLKKTMLVYNIFQVILSYYIFWLGYNGLLEFGLFETKCLMRDESNMFRLLSAHYIYFLAKLTELTDTVLFVLRKKWNQVSFLHVYHHTIMFLVSWLSLKYETSYTLIFLGTINSFIHVIMYTYYGLAMFPELKKYLWWKKYITKMQLIQFLLVTIHIQINTLQSECPISYFLLTMVWAHCFLFLYLFGDFYVKSYINKRNAARIANEKEQLNKNVQSYNNDNDSNQTSSNHRRKNSEKSR